MWECLLRGNQSDIQTRGKHGIVRIPVPTPKLTIYTYRSLYNAGQSVFFWSPVNYKFYLLILIEEMSYWSDDVKYESV